jgi:hypothetical protein
LLVNALCNNESTVCTQAAQVTVQVTDATPTTFKSAEFVAAVANALNIPASQVAVTSVKASAARAGAVQITFVIKPSATPGPVPASQVLSMGSETSALVPRTISL